MRIILINVFCVITMLIRYTTCRGQIDTVKIKNVIFVTYTRQYADTPYVNSDSLVKKVKFFSRLFKKGATKFEFVVEVYGLGRLDTLKMQKPCDISKNPSCKQGYYLHEYYFRGNAINQHISKISEVVKARNIKRFESTINKYIYEVYFTRLSSTEINNLYHFMTYRNPAAFD